MPRTPKEPNKFMPPKIRRPREELQQAADQVEKAGYVLAGSWRREKPTVGDLDIVVPPALDIGTAIEEFQTFFGYEQIRGGSMKSEGIATYHDKPLLINLWWCPEPSAWGALFLFATGPFDLNIAMRAKAQSRTWKLSQYGLFDADDQQLDDSTEESIFQILQLQFLSPVERETWRAKLIPYKPKKSIEVSSSSGDKTYTVTIEGGKATHCECIGFTYRHHCRHLEEAEAMLK